MNEDEVRRHAYSMPLHSPSYPRGPYRFVDREYLIVSYHSDPEILRSILPAPLKLAEPIVKYEFINMPDSTGFGSYCESGQAIPVIFDGQCGLYIHAMYLNDHAPIVGGRELWGFPKKLGEPVLRVERETLIGTLQFGGSQIATATMGYKHTIVEENEVLSAMQAPNFVLKIIPHVDGTLRILELVRYYQTDICIKGAWSGPGALELRPHAMAPVADLPVHSIKSTLHFISDLTLGMGEVVHDYLN
ncbi:MAG: acetoacetate decarboxylase [Gammaproteobacteria bacterium]